MKKDIIPVIPLFEVIDIFGKKIRTTERWWNHITNEKHKEVTDKILLVKDTIIKPEEVRQSEIKKYIFLYYRKFELFWMCAVVRHLNGDGFLMTAYITNKNKKKGIQIWPK